MSPRTNRQTGVTLVELMVALAIGMVITLAVTQAYLTGVDAQRSQTDLSRSQESARFSFYLLGNEIRKAGFRNTFAVGSTAQEFCATYSTPGSLLIGSNDPTTLALGGSTTATILNKSDSITLSFYGEDNAAGTAADGSILDCIGNPVRRGNLVADTLYVAADATNNNEPTLYCSSRLNGGTPTVTPLIPGVDSIQFLYGDDSDADGTVNRYVPYNNISSPDNVLSVMASLVVRTANTVSLDTAQKVFNHFGTTYAPSDTPPTGDTGSVYTAPNDGRVRLQFSTVIALRNFALCQ